MQENYPGGRPALSVVQTELNQVPIGVSSAQLYSTNAVSIRTRTLTPTEHDEVIAAISKTASTTELSFTSVGPALGAQFTSKALWALFIVIVAVVIYIAFAFRKVSRPVPSWGYGLTVVAMLAIDLIVPIGFYAVFCHFTGAQVDSLFIVALLALLGYCVNDVIVVFDRVREHLAKNEKTGIREDFSHTIGKSIDETITRSINTALTVALVLIVLIFVGPEATRNFVIVMLVGVIAGTFSSICRSAPLLIPIANWFSKK